MSDSAATYGCDGHVATITYNRPDKLNAVNGAMREALNAAWDQFMADEDAWVVIVTGAGRAFCAGADMVDGAGAVGTWPGSYWEIPTINSFESGLEVWKPTIAAVNGPCVGYGLTAAAACDFLLASDRATFMFPEVQLGVPTIVGSIRLPPRIGWANALELLLTGDSIDAERAREMGLAWRVVPHEELMTEARTLADRLCQGAPLAVRATKEMAWRSQFLPWAESVRMGETMRRVVGATDDARAGMAARARGETAVWQGR
ncbi:MAG: enoyl-CoA hydratase/isomerase family protein [Acidimicrobiia bacterium]|nr:enoyl-CoA hydratase/isomerase family protein [Acidimicrobiia bacterium]